MYSVETWPVQLMVHLLAEVATEESLVSRCYDDTTPTGLSRRHQQDVLRHYCSNTVSVR